MYAAPELLAPVPVYDPQAADIWSLGIILFSMMSKHAPMNSARVGDAHFQAFCQDRAAYVNLLLSSQQLEHTMSVEAKDLFLKMTVIDPAKRITIEGVLQHPFINSKQPSLGIKMDFGSRRRARSLESPPPTKWKKDGPQRVRQKVHQTMRELAGVMLKQTAGTIV
jgi:serine/threonine protein kinase